MEERIRELVKKDNFTKDYKYNAGLRKLMRNGVDYRDQDVDYYLSCNGFRKEK